MLNVPALNGKSAGGNLVADLSYGCGRSGFGFGDEFFEFALDVGALAQHLGREDAVGVDGEVVRNGVDTEEIAEVMVGIAVLDPGHLILVDEVLPLGLVGVPADAD